MIHYQERSACYLAIATLAAISVWMWVFLHVLDVELNGSGDHRIGIALIPACPLLGFILPATWRLTSELLRPGRLRHPLTILFVVTVVVLSVVSMGFTFLSWHFCSLIGGMVLMGPGTLILAILAVRA